MQDNNYSFPADFATKHLDMSWTDEHGLTGEGRTLSAVTFSIRDGRVFGALKIAVEDAQGHVSEVNVGWDDTHEILAAALAELLKAERLDKLISPLKAAREEQGLSQREVGERMGYEGASAQQIIHRWETWAREPGASALAAWADALGRELVVSPKV
jgi:DNA-binding transcriptional regulator YiaG